MENVFPQLFAGQHSSIIKFIYICLLSHTRRTHPAYICPGFPGAGKQKELIAAAQQATTKRKTAFGHINLWDICYWQFNFETFLT